MSIEETPSFQKEDDPYDPEISDEYDEEEQEEFEQEQYAQEQENMQTMEPKFLELNIRASVDNTNTKNAPKYAKHHIPQDSIKQTSISTTPTPQLTDIVIDNTTDRREKFLNKSFIQKCCRGFRVQIAAILSICDFWCNIFVILLFLLRAHSGSHFIFYIWGVVIGLFLFITSIISYRMGPAESSCNKLSYFCQIGICFECQNSLNHDNYGHATYTFKLINFLESMSRALPLSILKIFILIWYQSKYPYWSQSNYNWLLILSLSLSITSYSFWFTSHIKDTLRDKFNDVFESIIPKANKYDGDYNQDPSQSIKKFKMNWFNKIVFCIFIGFDFITRCGITLVLLRYSPAVILNSPTLNYFILPICLIMIESVSYFLFLYYLSDLYRNDIKYQYHKMQMFVMIVMSVITVTPFYNDCTKMNINYRKKLFVLFFNMLLRLMIMSTCMFLLVYFTDFTLSMVQTYVCISFAVIQFVLIIYSTHIIYKCESLTYIAWEKTKSQSMAVAKSTDLR